MHVCMVQLPHSPLWTENATDSSSAITPAMRNAVSQHISQFPRSFNLGKKEDTPSNGMVVQFVSCDVTEQFSGSPACLLCSSGSSCMCTVSVLLHQQQYCTDPEESLWTPQKATSLCRRSTNFPRGLYTFVYWGRISERRRCTRC